MTKFNKIAGALLVPAAAAAVVSAAPAANAAEWPCYSSASVAPMFTDRVQGFGTYQACYGHQGLVEIYRWVNGSPVRVATSGWQGTYGNQGTIATSAPRAYGCHTYYTKFTIANKNVVRSAGKTICF